jgi:hypothetical protein
MALSPPVPSKDWRISSNNLVGNAANGTTAYRNFWWTLVDMFVNPTSYTWRDMTGAVRSGTPGVDTPVACGTGSTSTWSTEAGLTFGTTYNANPHSWYVLTFPGIGSNFQLLIDLTNNGSAAWTTLGTGSAGTPAATTCGGMYVSTSVGFSGATGSSIRPYSSDETPYMQKCFGTGVQWAFMGLSASTPWRGRLHMMRAVDGSCNRVVFFYNNYPIFFMLLDVLKDPFTIQSGPNVGAVVNDVSVPWIGCGMYSQTSNTSILLAASGNNGLLINAGSGVPYTTRLATGYSNAVGNRDLWPIAPYVWFTSAPVGAAELMTAPGDGDNGWPIVPLSFACYTAGYREYMVGKTYDFFICPFVFNHGDYVQDANYCWAAMGETFQPWDGTVMQTMV